MFKLSNVQDLYFEIIKDDTRLGMLLDHLIIGNISMAADISTVDSVQTVSGKTIDVFQNGTGKVELIFLS